MTGTGIETQFPRTPEPPAGLSRFWAAEKDRILRQLLISDIERDTGRKLFVYFARLDQAITESDADDLSEILQRADEPDLDIMIHTAGGLIDAVEELVAMLRLRGLRYRVVVPSFAKSGGTLIALSAYAILLGVNSELGPVDPQMTVGEYRSVSAEFVAADDGLPKIVRDVASTNVARGKKLARANLRQILGIGLDEPVDELPAAGDTRLDIALKKLSSPAGFGSHGAVIDFTEAKALGLPVVWMAPESMLWKRIWLLHCLYDFDTKRDNIGKIIESVLDSIARPPLVWD